jgi:hypothetical protein
MQRWWKADELFDTLSKSPSDFTGVHYPVLLKAAADLQAGRIKISDARKFRMLSFTVHRQDGYFSDLALNGTNFRT